MISFPFLSLHPLTTRSENSVVWNTGVKLKCKVQDRSTDEHVQRWCWHQLTVRKVYSRQFEQHEYTCLSSLQKWSRFWAPCVGVILHCLTTSSPCFKTQRKAISFLRPSRYQGRASWKPEKFMSGWMAANGESIVIYLHKLNQKCCGMYPDGLQVLSGWCMNTVPSSLSHNAE